MVDIIRIIVILINFFIFNFGSWNNNVANYSPSVFGFLMWTLKLVTSIVIFEIEIRYASNWCFTEVLNFHFRYFALSLLLKNPLFICKKCAHFLFWFFHNFRATTFICHLYCNDFTFFLLERAYSLNFRRHQRCPPLMLFL